MSESKNKGGFTLPGETGFEKLTLDLAKRWGADVIRDSDGTALSDEILDAGYDIYSTICPVREHNEWIKKNLQARQQTFLCTAPATATGSSLSINIMEGFYSGQFEINDSPNAMKYWQVYDRSTDTLLPKEKWSFDPKSGTVKIETVQWRQYTVSFLAWRIWEEISMYNHVTNNWDKEHLMQLDPYNKDAREYLKGYMKKWCEDRPKTNVVRFTALFYNFVWIWGSDERNRNLFVDWASYDFTVCPDSLDDFEKEYKYALTAEDFVRQGKYNATHRVPSQKKRDWMTFISRFVREASRELIDIVHEAGKKAYVFYDDNWVGMEPYNGHFEEFGFDGIIKCVFSGYEVRLCANVPAPAHEIRFHPYLFPVGLGGLPTFSEGGRPGDDARQYWINTRRALLRQKIERCGLGGYLSLTRGHDDFIVAMDEILGEFRDIGSFHDMGGPYNLKQRIAVLHSWGKLRSWTLSGHFHETDRHLLIHIIESLAGMPFDVKFISFEDVKNGALNETDIVINAGEAGDAWSGGTYWADNEIVEKMTEWVHNGGIYFGFGEPSAIDGYNKFFRMAHILGMDLEKGEGACHGKWAYEVKAIDKLIPSGLKMKARDGLYLTDGNAKVLAEIDGKPILTMNDFGKGKGIYFSNYEVNADSTRLLQNLFIFTTTGSLEAEGITDDAHVDCAVYPSAKKLVFANNSGKKISSSCTWKGKKYTAEVEAKKIKVMELD